MRALESPKDLTVQEKRVIKETKQETRYFFIKKKAFTFEKVYVSLMYVELFFQIIEIDAQNPTQN